jgi:hypothetical protein
MAGAVPYAELCLSGFSILDIMLCSAVESWLTSTRTSLSTIRLLADAFPLHAPCIHLARMARPRYAQARARVNYSRAMKAASAIRQVEMQ